MKATIMLQKPTYILKSRVLPLYCQAASLKYISLAFPPDQGYTFTGYFYKSYMIHQGSILLNVSILICICAVHRPVPQCIQYVEYIQIIQPTSGLKLETKQVARPCIRVSNLINSAPKGNKMLLLHPVVGVCWLLLVNGRKG